MNKNILIIEDDDDREFMTWLFRNYNRLGLV